MAEFLQALKQHRFDFFTGVACSLLAPLIEDLEGDPVGYVPAPREDLAVGLAAGAFFGGRWPAALMQNSGLGYCLNTLTSLNLIYKIPLLMVVGYRGYLGKDAPEHWVMGKHCEALLKEVGIPVWIPEPRHLSNTLVHADEAMRRLRIPVALLIRPGVLEE